jgi:hypothetical protein
MSVRKFCKVLRNNQHVKGILSIRRQSRYYPKKFVDRIYNIGFIIVFNSCPTKRNRTAWFCAPCGLIVALLFGRAMLKLGPTRLGERWATRTS